MHTREYVPGYANIKHGSLIPCPNSVIEGRARDLTQFQLVTE